MGASFGDSQLFVIPCALAGLDAGSTHRPARMEPSSARPRLPLGAASAPGNADRERRSGLLCIRSQQGTGTRAPAVASRLPSRAADGGGGECECSCAHLGEGSAQAPSRHHQINGRNAFVHCLACRLPCPVDQSFFRGLVKGPAICSRASSCGDASDGNQCCAYKDVQ